MEARSVDYSTAPAKSSGRRRAASPRAASRVAVSSAGDAVVDSRVLAMDAAEFGRFEECMTKPAKPSKAMIEAAKLHKMLLSSS